MAFNVNQFRNHISKYNEFAKNDKFEVWIPVPNNAALKGEFGMRELAFQCEVAELPGKAISMAEFRHYGFTNRVPYAIAYNEITLGFVCNGEMIERKFFDSWMESMVSTENGLVSYQGGDDLYEKYNSDIIIKQYSQTADKNGDYRTIYECTLIDAIPTSMSALPLSWQDGSIHKMSVTFAYKKWVVKDSGVSAEATQTDAASNYSNNMPKN